MDFGIVKMLGGDTQTATGGIIGTVAYMAPEQIRGERTDHRTDIYALGVVLFEMISGQRPFQGDSAPATMMMHLTQPVPDIRTLNQSTPVGLMRVVERALAKSPAERFQTAAEMANALQAIGLGRGPTAVIDDSTVIQPVTTAAGQPRPASLSGTMSETPRPLGVVHQPPPPIQQGPSPRPAGPRWLLAGGLVAGLLIFVLLCAAAAVFGSQYLEGSSFGGDTATPTREIFVAEVTDDPVGPTAGIDAEGVVITDVATEAATDVPVGDTATATVETEPTEQPSPTSAPTETASPTAPLPSPTALASPTIAATPTAAGPSAHITDITSNGSSYSIAFTTAGFDYGLPGTHVHFFFNTVAPEQAGVPGNGPWELYGGPSPFTEYGTADRPAGATQMCILVANSDHSIQPGTGNCVALP
jgi:eukaryotic-like serine/threonine-protein kinase